MALRTLNLENFRGMKSLEIQFHPSGNLVTGQNEVGKTTIREAICFAFTGTDSVGNRRPRHLITNGESGLKATLTTDKATFVRTLTDKGNGTLKLVRNGVPTTLTQSQLEGMLGSSDLFLSAFIPGYFLELPAEKQHAVLAEVQPKVDRLGLLESVSGLTLSPEEKIRYNPTARRPDVVATYVAQDRREVEGAMDRLRGEQDSLLSVVIPEKPREPVERARLVLLSGLKQRWDRYTADLDRAQEVEAQTARIRERNAERAKRRRALEGEQALLKEITPPKDPGFGANYDYLRTQLKTIPSKPALGTVVESDNCPTCGQTVGLKHREHVRSKNEEVMARWEKEQQEVLAHNQKINEQFEEMRQSEAAFRSEVAKIEEENRKVRARKHAIALELERLRDETPQEAQILPEHPGEDYNPEEYARCEQVVTEYNRKVTEYEYAIRQKERSATRLSEISAQLEKLGSQVARLYHLEKALKALPAEEAKHSVGFEVEDLEINVGEKVEVLVKGIPYPLLSRGRRAKTGIQICLKIGSMMKSPIRMVFLDDADLVDEISFPEGIQWFAAKVVPGQKEVAVQSG